MDRWGNATFHDVKPGAAPASAATEPQPNGQPQQAPAVTAAAVAEKKPVEGTAQIQDGAPKQDERPNTADGRTSETRGDEGWTPDKVQVLADFFSNAPGVTSTAIEGTREWFVNTYGPNAQPIGDVKRAHPYNFSSFGFSDAAQPYVDSFGNMAAARGMSDAEVFGIVRHYMDEFLPRAQQHQAAQARESTAFAREIEEQDQKDCQSTRATMTGEWGRENYARNVRAINAYLDALPAAEREAIESRVLDDGRRALNDPATLRDLLERSARGADTRAKTTVVPSTATAIDSEIAALERLMRTDRAAYNRQEGRYRQLLSMRDGS